MNLPAGISYIGVNDRDIDLFEGQFKVPHGISYNSYLIEDDKIVVMDSVDKHFADQWLTNIKAVLGQKEPDYLVISHMEPDHSGSLEAFITTYPNTTLVTNAKGAPMLEKFFGSQCLQRAITVKNEDELCIGSHTLKFIFAPMVHWPEVMMVHESTTNTLFSADAFGKFGALDHDENWACEARRYYFGIVAPYGKQVQNTLAKLGSYKIERICPLHGPVLDEDLEQYIGLYSIWSSYEPEDEGATIVYASVYGHTEEAAKELAQLLEQKGKKTALFDLNHDDRSEAIEDAFRYSTLICAGITYNGSIMPSMKGFLDELAEKKFQKRSVAFIQNGSWAPNAIKAMKAALEGCKDLEYLDTEITITGSKTQEIDEQLKELADKIA